ncbi:histone deacetylase family protein [Rhodovulum sp. DZ06]|uniref:histone deacetylase family protein n=1 Tax=Rhodovulum sp. DZ06 TaxID=3425126 RepID=UPI003D33335D
MLPIAWHPDYLAPLRPGHRFPMSKYGYLRGALAARGLMPPGGFIAPAAAPLRLIAAVHALDYVERVENCALTRGEERAIGLPSTAAVARRGRLSCAGTLLAARLALEHGIACNAAGGSHHAGPDGGAGFCVFNDVAVAAQALLDEGIVRRVLVVDCDVHQGDGTARIFEGDPRVFTYSLHAQNNYPSEKAVSDLDRGLPDGTGDAAYLAALSADLPRIIAAAGADIAFYNAGVDPWAGDRLGRLSLSLEGLRARDRLVLGALRAAGLPVCGALGGGYSTDPEELAARHAILFEEAAALS